MLGYSRVRSGIAYDLPHSFEKISFENPSVADMNNDNANDEDELEVRLPLEDQSIFIGDYEIIACTSLFNHLSSKRRIWMDNGVLSIKPCRDNVQAYSHSIRNCQGIAAEELSINFFAIDLRSNNNMILLNGITNKDGCGFLRTFSEKVTVCVSTPRENNHLDDGGEEVKSTDFGYIYTDASKSWLSSHLGLPVEVSFIIRTFLCPPQELMFQKGDLWISYFSNSNLSSDFTKSVSIVARRKRDSNS